ncbi:hypothetical protein KGM_211738A, partial [Danaus plexippus plexippus]
MSCPGKETHGS